MKINKLFLIPCLFFLFSCGVVLEDLRIAGEWELKSVEFYYQNTQINTLKTYYGKGGTSPSSDQPLMAEFFELDEDDLENSMDFTINFDESNQIEIIGNDGADKTIVNYDRGEWAINSFDNSLLIHIRNNKNNAYAKGIWRDGFQAHLNWPMPDYKTLELHLKAEEVGKPYFYVELSNKTIKVKSMKGIFNRVE